MKSPYDKKFWKRICISVVLFALASWFTIAMNSCSLFDKPDTTPEEEYKKYSSAAIDSDAPIVFLFKDDNYSQWYEATIDGEKYIYIFNRHTGDVALTKK